MIAQKISDMTLHDLQELVVKLIDERLQECSSTCSPVKTQRMQEVFNTIDQYLITPSSEEPTGSEMILEERQQWRNGM